MIPNGTNATAQTQTGYYVWETLLCYTGVLVESMFLYLKQYNIFGFSISWEPFKSVHLSICTTFESQSLCWERAFVMKAYYSSPSSTTRGNNMKVYIKIFCFISLLIYNYRVQSYNMQFKWKYKIQHKHETQLGYFRFWSL
jgi:hypothetical protein